MGNRKDGLGIDGQLQVAGHGGGTVLLHGFRDHFLDVLAAIATQAPTRKVVVGHAIEVEGAHFDKAQINAIFFGPRADHPLQAAPFQFDIRNGFYFSRARP